MQYLIIFFILELLQLVFFLNKRKNPLVVCNSTFQLILAFGAVLLVSFNLYEFEVVFYPLVAWVILNFIINYSMSGPIKLDINHVTQSRSLKNIFIIYAICSIYFIIIKGFDAVNVYITGNYYSMYWEARSEDFEYHSNIFEQIAINYMNYLYVPAALYGFYLISSDKQKQGTLLCLLVFLDKLVWSTAYSSRADLFAIIILFLMLLFVFKKYLNKRLFKKISKVGIIGGSAAAAMIVLITLSRFDGVKFADWIFAYFGRSPLTFQDHVASITRFGDGHVFFSYIKGLLPYTTQNPTFTRDTGYNFVPELARLYDDFGWWFVPFILLPICFVLYKFMKKRALSFADAYVLFNTFMIILIGNLYKTAEVIAVLMTIFIFFVFKKSEKGVSNKSRVIIK